MSLVGGASPPPAPDWTSTCGPGGCGILADLVVRPDVGGTGTTGVAGGTPICMLASPQRVLFERHREAYMSFS